MPSHPLSGPIPGENYTSDTKNYPWHRPPEFSDLDKAIDMIAKRLMDEENAPGLLTMIESGFTIAELTSTFVMSGVGSGKWTPDFAILLAGPVSHIMYLMCKGYGIDCDLGIDGNPQRPTKLFFDEVKPIDKKKVSRLDDQIDLTPVKQVLEKSGFMNMPAPAQAAGGGMEQPQPQEEQPTEPQEGMM